MSFSAALMCFMKRVSMVLFLKELLQCSTKAESSMVTTSTSSNHVRMVVSLSCSCNRLSTLCHTSEMEFNESSPFPLNGPSISVFEKNLSENSIAETPGKVYTYSNISCKK